jgi:hypothetical protein
MNIIISKLKQTLLSGKQAMRFHSYRSVCIAFYFIEKPLQTADIKKLFLPAPLRAKKS